jgi:hypothetical protein
MPCETITDNQGHVTMILCGRRRRQPCKFCHERPVEKLCDFPVAKGKTCDAGMCAVCATSIAHEVDYCLTHKNQKPGPQQTSLFGGER